MIDEALIKEYLRKYSHSYLKVLYLNSEWEVYVEFSDPCYRGLQGYGHHHDLSSAAYLAFKDYEFFANKGTTTEQTPDKE